MLLPCRGTRSSLRRPLPRCLRGCGGDVNWRTALSYDAFQALRSARTVANVSPNAGAQGRTALGQSLAAQGFSASGSTGAISFLPSGDRNAAVLLVQVEPGSRSGTGFDFVPLP